MTTDKTQRVSRTQETRNADVIHETYNDVWEEKGSLDTSDIPAKPGFVQRWVRVLDRSGNPDRKNVFKMARNGWKPRVRTDVEKGMMFPNLNFDGQDVIGVNDMVLMERPEAQHKSQRDYIRSQTNQQISGVKTTLSGVHTNPLFVEPRLKISTDVSRGRMPVTDDD